VPDRKYTASDITALDPVDWARNHIDRLLTGDSSPSEQLVDRIIYEAVAADSVVETTSTDGRWALVGVRGQWLTPDSFKFWVASDYRTRFGKELIFPKGSVNYFPTGTILRAMAGSLILIESNGRQEAALGEPVESSVVRAWLAAHHGADFVLAFQFLDAWEDQSEPDT